MNVFVLCTGRSGSQTFMKACAHITNFSSSHESRSKILGEERFNHPENHIEGDNRLSWVLGQLDEKHGKDAYYVHLIRDKNEVAASFNNRWQVTYSIIKGYAHSIKMRKIHKLNSHERLQMCIDYYDTVNANIRLFLKDKPNKKTIHLENMKEDFQDFWNDIQAEGDKEAALAVLDTVHNANKKMHPVKKFLKSFT